jgi:hypothetical protein
LSIIEEEGGKNKKKILSSYITFWVLYQDLIVYIYRYCCIYRDLIKNANLPCELDSPCIGSRKETNLPIFSCIRSQSEVSLVMVVYQLSSMSSRIYLILLLLLIKWLPRVREQYSKELFGAATAPATYSFASYSFKGCPWWTEGSCEFK